MLNLQSIKEAAQQIKDKLTKSPLEQTLSEATSNENWNTPTKLLQEVAEATYGYTSCDTVIKFIWKRLDSDNREWRRILKTLNMIEYLVKNGAPRCVGEFRDNIFKIRSFSDFFLIESGSDKGLSIRDKTKQLVDLLSNEKLIEEERENAKKIRERLAAAGGVGAIGSNTSYQGYSSDSYKNNNNNTNNNESNYKGYGNNDSYKGYGSDSTNKDKDQQTYQQKYGSWETGGGLDKYKKPENNSSNTNVTNNTTVTNNTANNITWPNTQQSPAPFTEPIQKLAKPGEKWDVPAPKTQQQQQQQTQQVQQVQQVSQQKVNIIDIWDVEPQQQQQQQQQQQPQKVQPLQPPPQKQQVTQDWGSFETAKPQTTTKTTTSLLPDDLFGAPQQQPQPQFTQQQTLPTYTQQPQQQPQLISLTFNTQQQQAQVQQQQQVQNPLYVNQLQYQQLQQNTVQYQQQQQQQTNLPYQQYQSLKQNQQQLLFNQQQYTQQQQNNNNNLYSGYQQYKQPQQTQQPIQQQKQDDFGFGDFVSAQPKTNNNNNQATDLLGMLDLKKEKAELEQKKQIPIAQQSQQQQQQQILYASQMDMDQFQINYQRPQQYQYQQGR